MLWKHVKGADLEREYRFHHERRWRADFAHVEARVLIGACWLMQMAMLMVQFCKGRG
jgi:hypothetical protein